MSSNKRAKNELIRRYGNRCFIERLGIRTDKGRRYKGCSQYKRMKMLTFHHIRMKKDGGKATVENGALLSNENHQWFHKQSEQDQAVMNEMFQELKRQIDANRISVEMVDEVDCPFEINCVELWMDEEKLHTKTLTKQRIIQKQKRKEKTELQRIKKEWEDR